jgi:8-oxo-dGTP pyrophosphatase MutT (NUDIX family)
MELCRMGDGRWTVIRRVTVYDSPWVRLHRDDVRLPDGSVIDGHHVVEVPAPAVGIVPVGDDGRILLIEHHRFITGTTGWEVPAGRFDAGDTVESAAARELLEETGHSAGKLHYLGNYFPINGLCDHVFHVCVGRELIRRGEIQDTNEVMRLGWFDRREIAGMIRDGVIKDGLSVTALLWFLMGEEISPTGCV